MNEPMILELTVNEAAEIEAVVKQCVSELDHYREQIIKDREESARLRDETRAILAQLKAA